MRNYTLDSAEQRNHENPESFKIRSREHRGGLMPGMFAKLIFEFPTPRGDHLNMTGERMWVRITEKKDGRYTGVLSNIPTFFDKSELVYGETVHFGPEHIIDIDVPEMPLEKELQPDSKPKKGRKKWYSSSKPSTSRPPRLRKSRRKS